VILEAERLRKSEKENSIGSLSPALGSDLQSLLIRRLAELEKEANTRSGIIRFPVVFEKLCRNFSVNKKDAWGILFHLSELKVIKIVPYQGIVITNQKNG
jgi:hypothetical protein